MDFTIVDIPTAGTRPVVSKHAKLYAELERAAGTGQAISVTASPLERNRLRQLMWLRYRSSPWRVRSRGFNNSAPAMTFWLEPKDEKKAAL